MSGYELTRRFFDFCFENPEKISPNHVAIYCFAIEHCNRLGWKNKFGFPTQMAMDALGIKKHQTYIRYFQDLVDWGFFDLVQKSQNQYSSNIISLISAMPKNGKALDKAIINHTAKQTETNGQSNGQSNSPINKLQTINQETINQESVGETSSPSRQKSKLKETLPERELEFKKRCYPFVGEYTKEVVKEFFEYWSEKNTSQTKMKWELQPTFEISKRLANWAKREKTFNHNTKNQPNEQQYTPRISKSEWESKTGRKYEGQDDPNA